MVILGGLEVVAAGYLIHKHAQNKKDKQKLQEEAAALEEQQYRIFPNDRRDSRHRRSESRDRHGHRRRHSADGRYKQDEKYRKDGRNKHDDGRPTMSGAIMPPPQQSQPQPQPQPYVLPPPYASVAPQQQAMYPPPADMKYGWTDPVPGGQQQQPGGVVTGWPAHWKQNQTSLPGNGMSLQPLPPQDGRRGDAARGRQSQRARSAQPHVHFTNSVRGGSRSPPGYRSRNR